ncbi:hypothetical protein [Lactobacillus sp. Sy-1]|uniref:hypothetical protein n=1 Tax=Lactobacillus sp. Sy-1 TaxID=2109645 RepID=UPI001C5B20A8|nr:hypothetical protein [Lactobacillus sp. Sy-1]MBW1606055.1 hypothetical protein [Lactobacillus sp. Sy-1]
MKNIKAGDIIINVHHQHIMGISVARRDAYTKPKPAEFQDAVWDVSGWQVDLKIKPLNIPLEPERSFFGDPNNRKDKNDAFNKNGTINQGYLFELNPVEINHIKDMLLEHLLAIRIIDTN